VSQKSDEVSGMQADCNKATSDLKETTDELEELEAYRADLHGQCDFIIKNFDLRAEARENEIEAIGEAKAILSGAK